MKNCKIKGNFGEIEIMKDSTVSTDFDTLVAKQTTPNNAAGLDYTAFMINKEKESKLWTIFFIGSLTGSESETHRFDQSTE